MNERHPVYVFDVDGVITNPQKSQVNEGVIEEIHILLDDGALVAVNTGRSFEWVQSNLIDHLKSRRKATFDHFIAVCEKGGEAITWRFNKQTREQSEFALSRKAYEKTKAVFDQNGARLRTMFWDATKRTMASIEKLPAPSLEEFHSEQRFLLEQLQQHVSSQEARIDSTTIATDVESPFAGKYAGAKLVYEWARQTAPAEANHFISIGDSASDYEMARYFAEQGAHSVFAYVGKLTDKIPDHSRVEFIVTHRQYDLGALEFLRRKRSSAP